MPTVREIQVALRKAGYEAGPADGIIGRRTIAAIKAFQADKGLHVDGIAGSATLARLFPYDVNPKPSSEVLVPWLAEARRLQGLRETPGPADNPVIIGWAQKLGGWIAKAYTKDSDAWCGLGMAHFVGSTLPNEPLPANPLGAQQWLKMGRPLNEPVVGAIVVFWRVSRTGWQGHVGIIVGISADRRFLRVLGANQGDEIREDWFEINRVLGYRWPATAPLPNASHIPVLTIGGKLSTNEA